MHFNSYCSAWALSASLDSFSYLVLAVFPGMPELTPGRRILHGEAIFHQFWLNVFLLTGDMLLTLLLSKLSTFLPVGTLQGGSPLLPLVTVITLLFFSALITHKQTTSLTYFLSSSFIVYMPYGGNFFVVVVSFIYPHAPGSRTLQVTYRATKTVVYQKNSMASYWKLYLQTQEAQAMHLAYVPLSLLFRYYQFLNGNKKPPCTIISLKNY